MKVNKEEMFGMYAALKSYLGRDHKKEWNEWLDRCRRVKAQLETIPTVKGETIVDKGPANAFPSLHVTWDQSKVKTTPKDVLAALKSGTPSIVANAKDNILSVGVVLLKPEQVDIVARRVKEILQQVVNSGLRFINCFNMIVKLTRSREANSRQLVFYVVKWRYCILRHSDCYQVFFVCS
jgi:L-seryl-tRNA(Ser) seleniumtransferase